MKWIFQSKLDEKEVLHVFLPSFVEKSYFTLAMIFAFAIPPPLPPPPTYPHRHFKTFNTA